MKSNRYIDISQTTATAMNGAKSPMVAEKPLLVRSPIDLEAAPDAIGTKPPAACSLTPREMGSLAAISDTLLPSMDFPGGSHEESVDTFYQISASMMGTPEAAGEYIGSRMHHEMRWLLRAALWLLSTWCGTFVLCGTKSLSGRFPFFRKFAEVDQRRREEIVLGWSSSWFYLLRLLFRGMKSIVLLFHFTKVDEKKENPTWKALGYCGPDPEHTAQIKSTATTTNGDQESLMGPLYRAMVYMESSSRNSIASALSQAGLSLTTRPHPKMAHKKPILTIQCDAVVVGSGSGGGVVAGLLAQAGYKVVVLEKGNYHARNSLTLLEGHAMEQMYEGFGMLATNDTGVVILSGSTVGGGSAINWAASLRTPEHVISEWRDEHGIELFGSYAYNQALDAVCERMGVQGEVDDDSLNNSVLRRGCEELGYPVKNIPRNSPRDHHCGWCCFGCRDGRKKGTAETWLVDMLDSGNGVVLPGCTATSVTTAKRKRRRGVATGVRFEYENGWTGEKESCVVEAKVTVVACGALNTPVLLRNSGLKNAHIGKNLHLHPVVMVWGYFPNEKKKSYEGGIMTAMSPVVYNAGTTGYGAMIQTPQLHPGMFSVLTPWVSGGDFKDRMTRFASTAHMLALARDKGSGSVDSSTGWIRYQMDSADEESLQKGVERMLRIAAAAGAVEVGTHHCKGDRLNVKTASSHEFEGFVKGASKRRLRGFSTPICSAHQMGSCRMGASPETSAVSPEGEAWEVEGLYVADASVFPTALGVNPMVTVQAIAYCTAQAVIEKLRRKIKKKKSDSMSR